MLLALIDVERLPPIVVAAFVPTVVSSAPPIDVVRSRPTVIVASRSATMAMSWPVIVTAAVLPRDIVMPSSVTLIEYSPLGLVKVPENGWALQTYAVWPAASVIAAPPAGQLASFGSSCTTVGLAPRRRAFPDRPSGPVGSTRAEPRSRDALLTLGGVDHANDTPDLPVAGIDHTAVTRDRRPCDPAHEQCRRTAGYGRQQACLSPIHDDPLVVSVGEKSCRSRPCSSPDKSCDRHGLPQRVPERTLIVGRMAVIVNTWHSRCRSTSRIRGSREGVEFEATLDPRMQATGQADLVVVDADGSEVFRTDMDVEYVGGQLQGVWMLIPGDQLQNGDHVAWVRTIVQAERHRRLLGERVQGCQLHRS